MNSESDRNYVIENQRLEKDCEFQRQQVEFKLDNEDEIEQLRENRDIVLINKFNKQKYNNFIVESRQNREKKRIQSAIHTKLKVIEERNKDSMVNTKTQNHLEGNRKKPKTLDED